jgi:hypothetical protein
MYAILLEYLGKIACNFKARVYGICLDFDYDYDWIIKKKSGYDYDGL